MTFEFDLTDKIIWGILGAAKKKTTLDSGGELLSTFYEPGTAIMCNEAD
ncbi:MAG: hypothetical protein ACYTDW_17050 [Planctomycetota bacterium]